MANSVHRDINGPDWPLGLITVAAPGTPVDIMSVLDAAAASETTASAFDPEFTPRFKAFIFTPLKSVAPVVNNAGFIYIVRKGAVGGPGNRTDTGAIVTVLQFGSAVFPLIPFILSAAELSLNVLSGYRYFIDADNAGDGCLVTGLVAG